ncbi:MAG: thiamine-phosphate kinase [Myxococcales bacterium]|nr:thiamine-phosphate kinase [Myxococcales bacterium]
MQLRELGEFALIDQIAREAQRDATSAGAVRLGIGDDAALLRPNASEEVAISVDASVEGVHFELGVMTPRRIGAHALIAALSDLAAMGARPLGALLSLAAPAKSDAHSIRGILRGAVRTGSDHRCPVVGGNLTRAREISLHVTVVGAVRRGRALVRSKAKPDQRVLVTGRLGEAALADARRARASAGSRARVPLPQPRIEAGRRLTRISGVGACIDLSDGLASDLRHVLAASGVGAEIDLATLPRRRGFDRACRALGLAPEAALVGFGEDYELLFTATRRAPSAAAFAKTLGLPVTEIGIITKKGLRWRNGDVPRDAGWRHF